MIVVSKYLKGISNLDKTMSRQEPQQCNVLFLFLFFLFCFFFGNCEIHFFLTFLTGQKSKRDKDRGVEVKIPKSSKHGLHRTRSSAALKPANLGTLAHIEYSINCSSVIILLKNLRLGTVPQKGDQM